MANRSDRISVFHTRVAQLFKLQNRNSVSHTRIAHLFKLRVQDLCHTRIAHLFKLRVQDLFHTRGLRGSLSTKISLTSLITLISPITLIITAPFAKLSRLGYLQGLTGLHHLSRAFFVAGEVA